MLYNKTDSARPITIISPANKDLEALEIVMHARAPRYESYYEFWYYEPKYHNYHNYKVKVQSLKITMLYIIFSEQPPDEIRKCLSYFNYSTGC